MYSSFMRYRQKERRGGGEGKRRNESGKLDIQIPEAVMTTPYSVHSIVEPLSKDTPEMRALSKLCTCIH